MRYFINYVRRDKEFRTFLIGGFWTILFLIGANLSEVSWMYMPGIRLIAHAAAAIVMTNCLMYMVFPIMRVFQWLLEFWLCLYLKQKELCIKSRKRLARTFGIFKPIIGAGMYIIYACFWEIYQAEIQGRGIQTDQVTIDVLFSVLTAIFLIIFYRREITRIYIKNKKVIIEKFQYNLICLEAILEYGELKGVNEQNYNIKREYHQNSKLTDFMMRMILIFVALIPIWVSLEFVFIANLYVTLVMR